MRNGTQEELDAAREDATLLPFDAVFKVSEKGKSWDIESLKAYGYFVGDFVYRSGGIGMCGEDSVAFEKEGSEDTIYFTPQCLEVIK